MFLFTVWLDTCNFTYSCNTVSLNNTECLWGTYLVRNVQYWYVRRVWRYQRGNLNLYIEEEQTTQWPKEKVQKDKQRSTKHTYKTKDRVIQTPLKTGGELRVMLCNYVIITSIQMYQCSNNIIANLLMSLQHQ